MCADFRNLQRQVENLQEAGIDQLHFDIMDGHFVPNITFGPLVIEALRPVTSLPFDAHLMVSEPEKWVEPFAKAGADFVTVHVEATLHLYRLIQHIKSTGAKAGVSLNPATPVGSLEEILPDVDLILVMSVEPGFAGQPFVPGSIEKVKRVRELIERTGSAARIFVDGGIREDNIAALADAGMDCAVLGSGLFDPSRSFETVIRSLRAACEAGISR